jgi:hypothetical protein
VRIHHVHGVVIGPRELVIQIQLHSNVIPSVLDRQVVIPKESSSDIVVRLPGPCEVG